MSWIKDIEKITKKGGSGQFEESEIIFHIFENIGTTNKLLVDLGCGAYGGSIMSNVRDMMESGWKGFGVDFSAINDTWAIKYFIKPDNIVKLFQDQGVPYSFDFLNLDIDSSDFWVLKNLLEAGWRPRLICTEFNGTLDPEKSLVLQYEDGYTWDETNKYGYSFAAGKKLLAEHGYTIIFNQHETNIFAVLNDLVDEDPKVTAKQSPYHPTNPDAIWITY